MQNIERRIALVRNDRTHGSRWLVREAIIILRDLAEAQIASEDEHVRLLYLAAQELAHARPAMAALTSAVGRIINVQGGPPAMAHEARCLLEEYNSATRRIASYAEPFLHGQLMTCSISGTVLDGLVAHREHIKRVVVLEGRPRYEGRDMAQALSTQGIAVTLITDAQADIFLPECQGVVVGADSILANGDVINKAGTALLAWAAHGRHIPLIVLCETLKIAAHRWSEQQSHSAENLALLEEKEAKEVLEQSISGITVRNFYFDRTPSQLIGKVITEQGILERPAIRQIASKVKANERVLASKRSH